MEPRSRPISPTTRAACSAGLGAFWALGYFSLGARAETVRTLDPSIPLDALIPFVGWAVWPYLLGIACIGLPAVLVRSPALFRETAIAYAIAIGLSFLCFFLAPTEAESLRTQIALADLDDYTAAAVSMLHAIDPSTNLVPSLHVSLATVAACALARQYPAMQAKVVGLLVIVIASVLMLKQHTIVDALAGLTVAAIALTLPARFKLFRRSAAAPQEVR
jgi:membrane-associated phospholipid phosphatase